LVALCLFSFVIYTDNFSSSSFHSLPFRNIT
jgi:hypothetical protein